MKTLPGQRAQETNDTTAPRAAAGLRVMVAEDHDFQRHALIHLMRSLEASEIIEARDGAEALLKLRRAAGSVDLIILDLDMPKMDGMELMRHLGNANSDVAVIITSAHDSNVINSVQIMAEAYGIRLIGVVEKPATILRVNELLLAAHSQQQLYQTQTRLASPAFTLPDILAGIEAQQFEPFFQPKADLTTGLITGAEALARWRHPELGIIGPFAFIETLERSGNLDELTFMMLDKAARACRDWRAQGLDLSVSVNLSLTSLKDMHLADRIAGTVTNAGVEPKRITLEITESAALTDVAPALENLARLRLRGFGLSIDDFGTGFSSIQQLARIAFTELKIDCSFVSGIENKREARAIVEASIDMARRLNISSVAEGIETQSEWNALKAAGCDVAQGYFISKPVENDEFVAFCRKANR